MRRALRTVAIGWGVLLLSCGNTTPTCGTGDSCVEFTSHGHPECLMNCAADGGVCPGNLVCTGTSACCGGTACKAREVFVCCPASGC